MVTINEQLPLKWKNIKKKVRGETKWICAVPFFFRKTKCISDGYGVVLGRVKKCRHHPQSVYLHIHYELLLTLSYASTRECRKTKWIITTGIVTKSIWCTHSIFFFFLNLLFAHKLRSHTFCEGLKHKDLCIHYIDSMSSVLYDLQLFVQEQNGSGS